MKIKIFFGILICCCNLSFRSKGGVYSYRLTWQEITTNTWMKEGGRNCPYPEVISCHVEYIL